MLLKENKGRVSRGITLSRREMLRALGIGAGVFSLAGITGCTSLVRSLDDSLLDVEVYPTASMVMASQDRAFLKEQSKRLKEIIKAIKKGEGDTEKLLTESYQISNKIVDYWALTGIFTAVDQDLIQALKSGRLVRLPSLRVRRTMRKLQRELGLSNTELSGWDKNFHWKSNKDLLQALQEKGSEQLWRSWIANSYEPVLTAERPSSPSLEYTIDAQFCLWCAVLIAALIVVAYSEEANPPEPPGGGGGCFPQGTPIAIRQGWRPIEHIKPGDEVYAFDLSSQKLKGQTVLDKRVLHAQEFLVLDFGAEEIRCTPTHRFYIGQWAPANTLRPGMKVRSLEDGWREIQNIRKEQAAQPVFNLEVQENHNFFVGQLGLLVHNYKTP